VDIYRFDLMPADNDIVDKIHWHPRATPLPHTYYEKQSTADVDAKVAAICATQTCSYRPNYDPVTVMHAKRQLWSEFRVANALQTTLKGRYAAAVVIGSDIYVPKPIPMADIDRIKREQNRKLVFTTNNNNGAGGVTNGFYAGRYTKCTAGRWVHGMCCFVVKEQKVVVVLFTCYYYCYYYYYYYFCYNHIDLHSTSTSTHPLLLPTLL
jgi:hypothetical protein